MESLASVDWLRQHCLSRIAASARLAVAEPAASVVGAASAEHCCDNVRICWATRGCIRTLEHCVAHYFAWPSLRAHSLREFAVEDCALASEVAGSCLLGASGEEVSADDLASRETAAMAESARQSGYSVSEFELTCV